MSLAQRVRDFRYTKGWGPDELAGRAAISRTALYQIESGKTELPRAGTLRRIAMALDVSMENLLGHTEPAAQARPARGPSPGPVQAWGRGNGDWVPIEGAPMAAPGARPAPRFDISDGPRYGAAPDRASAGPVAGYDTGRDRDLVHKFQEVLDSPFGDAVARIVEETYRLLPQPVSAVPMTASTRAL
jgi:DNA-binding Xre family transcriptional regulator